MQDRRGDDGAGQSGEALAAQWGQGGTLPATGASPPEAAGGVPGVVRPVPCRPQAMGPDFLEGVSHYQQVRRWAESWPGSRRAPARGVGKGWARGNCCGHTYAVPGAPPLPQLQAQPQQSLPVAAAALLWQRTLHVFCVCALLAACAAPAAQAQRAPRLSPLTLHSSPRFCGSSPSANLTPALRP